MNNPMPTHGVGPSTPVEPELERARRLVGTDAREHFRLRQTSVVVTRHELRIAAAEAYGDLAALPDMDRLERFLGALGVRVDRG